MNASSPYVMPPPTQGLPSSAHLRMSHAAVITTALEESLTFYEGILGLSARGVEGDPIRPGRRRTMLCDASGDDVLELIEMTDLGHPAIPGRGGLHHLGFVLPSPEWHALRSYLDASGYPYQEVNACLFLRDPDGLVVELEQA